MNSGKGPQVSSSDSRDDIDEEQDKQEHQSIDICRAKEPDWGTGCCMPE